MVVKMPFFRRSISLVSFLILQHKVFIHEKCGKMEGYTEQALTQDNGIIV